VTDDRTSPAPVLAQLLEEDLDDLYEAAPCGYLSALPGGSIVKVNRTFLEWTGYTREELLAGARWPDLLTVGGRIFYETHLFPLLRMQGAVREIALDVRRREGPPLPVLVNAAYRTLDDPPTAVIRLTVFDATDRRRYERELLLARQEAEREAKARSDLIAMLSHDLRTPLNAIVMATTLLETTRPTSEQAQFIKVLRSSTNNAVSLVNNVLDLSRLDAGRAVLREREVDVRQVVNEVAESIALLVNKKPGVALNVAVDERIPPALLIDAPKLAQVLSNLLGNAAKFTHVGLVSLIVSLRGMSDERATVEFRVSDTGIGIPADRLPHIFDDFTQASDDIAEKYGGTGLGLAIARRLLRLFDAELSVSSTVGQGTTFTFALQLAMPTRDSVQPPRV
jgi:PAS domain S-box-containing protein